MPTKRDYKKEAEYHATETQKKRRAQRNAARRKMEASGKVTRGDGKDVHHTNRKTLSNKPGKIKVISRSKNRSMK